MATFLSTFFFFLPHSFILQKCEILVVRNFVYLVPYCTPDTQKCTWHTRAHTAFVAFDFLFAYNYAVLATILASWLHVPPCPAGVPVSYRRVILNSILSFPHISSFCYFHLASCKFQATKYLEKVDHFLRCNLCWTSSMSSNRAVTFFTTFKNNLIEW